MSGWRWLAVATITALACTGTPRPGAVAQVQTENAADAAASPDDWRRWAAEDVNAAYHLYVEHHPGVHDPDNPAFAQRLVAARDRGLAAAERANNHAGYAAALGAFSAELNDGHALATAKRRNQAASETLWPGFVAAWRGGNAVVHHASATAPAPVGAVIQSCDGKGMAEFIPQRVGYFFRREEGGQWWLYAPSAFLSSSTAASRPSSCRFRTPGGEEVEGDLHWTPWPETGNALWAAATDGERTSIGLSESRQGIFLIGLPDFQPNDDGVKLYDQLDEALQSRRGELMHARAVVLDLRHNNGGNSVWPSRVAQRLWGEEAFRVAMARYNRNVAIWWRASDGNTDHVLETIVPNVRRAGHEATAESFHNIGTAMREAGQRGEVYHVQQLTRDEKDLDGPPPPTDFHTPVYVITPGRCGSACLDAIDYFTRFANVKLIGAPTSADSNYMEVRSVDLPSGHGTLVIPTKMWAGRGRGNGEFYRPHIEMTDLHWSTATFLDWIERDIARR